MSHKKRVPLKEGMELELRITDSRGNYYIQQAVVETFIGSGATCLSYIVRINKDGINRTRMVMKEFYPSAAADGIRRAGTGLKISEETKKDRQFLGLKEGFCRSFAIQNTLAGSEAMEIMVKPYHMAEYGDSLYLLSEMHLGEVLSLSSVESMSDKLWLVYRAAEAVQLLHEQGYLYMDLNPKNILWIPSQKAVKLFDVDSIIPHRRLDEVHEIRVTKPYAAPELKELESWFDVNKHAFLKPSWDVYCLGLLLFELIFDRLPTEADQKSGYSLEKEVEEICWRNGYPEPEISEKINEILKRSLSRSFRVRYGSAQKFCEEVNYLKKRMDAQEFIPKKEYAKANEKISVYYLIDQNPLYSWSYEEAGKQVLDVAILGSHSIRTEFLKAVYASAHMRNSILRIRLYSHDAGEFLEKLETENPALAKTIRVFSGGTCIQDQWDPNICSRPVAEIYLCEQSDEINVCPSPYVLLLEEDPGKCRKIIQTLKNFHGEQKIFLAGLDYVSDRMGCDHLGKYNPGKVLSGHSEEENSWETPRDRVEFSASISTRPRCSYYDEELIQTEFLRRAMNVHAIYCRDRNKRISRKEIEDSFRADIYNMDSSLRSALAVKYKLASAGIDAEQEDLAEVFREKVLADTQEARALFEELSALEHLSWSAFMIITGWDLPEAKQVEAYAFEDGNDFKERKKKLHPCLCESRPGNGLTDLSRDDWGKETLPDSCLDGLDRTSIFLHQVAGRKADAAKREIRCFAEQLSRQIQQHPSETLRETFGLMEAVLEQAFQEKSSLEEAWKHAKESFLSACRENIPYASSVYSTIQEIERKLRVIFEYNAFRDYKRPDDVIIQGIPGILADGSIKTVIRPYEREKKNRWKNVLSALYLDPDELILTSKGGEGTETEFYQKFLTGCGRKTKVTLCRKNEVKRFMPGMGQEKPGYSMEGIVSENRETCIMKSAKSVFGREPGLTAEEFLSLQGVDFLPADGEKTNFPPYHILRCIWETCKSCGDSWTVLTDALRKAEKNNRYCLQKVSRENGSLPEQAAAGKTPEAEPIPIMTEPGRQKPGKRYTTDYVNGSALRCSGVDMLMLRCKEQGLIGSFELPGEEDELPVCFETDAEKTAEVLQNIIGMAGRDPFRHRFQLEKSDKQCKGRLPDQTEFFILDRTNYVKAEINLRNKERGGTKARKKTGERVKDTAEENAGEKMADPVLACLDGLKQAGSRNEGKQMILQNLKVQKEAGRLIISFKYASQAVKSCFLQSDRAAEAMLYYICRNLGTFDDLELVSELQVRAGNKRRLQELIGKEESGILAVKGTKMFCFTLKKNCKGKPEEIFKENRKDDVQKDLKDFRDSKEEPLILKYTVWGFGEEKVNGFRAGICEGELEETVEEIVEKCTN